ncbi:hypothetical protein ABW20_dc0107135 [Dactylellina cionopaga]|nr:hypothetical protein ABW20_dc0107135 [Dactylellina cionopaga]
MNNASAGAPKFDIWESDIPDLIFGVLDFLWNARPHLDQSRLKRIGSTFKDLFTQELQQKVDTLLEKYGQIVKIAQAHFEDSVLHESLRPRGHGKSVAMLSAHRELQHTTSDTRSPVICHFFFKKGEQDIQQSRTGFESILYQLLSSNELRKDTAILVTAVETLNPEFGEVDSRDSNAKSGNFWDSHASLCNTIREIAGAIANRVYIMVDALDECQDRREYGITQHLKSLVAKKTEGLRVIISARDSIDIVGELIGSSGGNLPDEMKVIEITSEKNSTDLEEYLKHDVGIVLQRRINQELRPDTFKRDLSRIVKVIHNKAKGDFTLARMIISNLKQPSRDSLEKKIERLPAALGDIYMASLESLTPDEQDFIVSALKWVVWTISGVTAIELSDHYRDIYKFTEGASLNSYERDLEYVDLEEGDLDEDGSDSDSDVSIRQPLGKESSAILSTSQTIKPPGSENSRKAVNIAEEDPYEDPDIKDTLYHLENSGQNGYKKASKIRIRQQLLMDLVDSANPETQTGTLFSN